MRPSFTPDESAGTVIAGRYELLGVIAHGGMGEVFRAYDRVRGHDVALKRMRSSKNHHEALFRAEYHGIARLRHPCIISVYEYGVDANGPYYTMELLDGQDLLECGPVSVRQGCAILRDVASSLALLHAQRVLHRDISPRNVRRTTSGRCKLIDFGVMTPFGLPSNMAGTPPFVSPEAWEGAVLDQRSDLYSLGALAYWLFARTFPYDPKHAVHAGFVPTTRIASLRRNHPEIPEALEALVMSLLEVDPAKRPSSAAEVIVQFNQIAELPADNAVELAQGYLSSAQCVGRFGGFAQIERALDETLSGRGSSWLVAGSAGIGRTRFLQEVAHVAQMRGVRVVRALGTGTQLNGELVRGVYQTLRRIVPAAYDALEPADQRALEHFDAQSESSADPTLRDALHTAVVQYIDSATANGAWLLLVDDLDRADAFSASCINALARRSSERSLLVLAAATGIERTIREEPAAAYARYACQLWLSPLDSDATASLVASLFGDTPNLERLSAWLFRQACGNPGLIMELCSLLLRRGTIRYVEGIFLLPADDIDESVPLDLLHTLSLRLEPAGPEARHLAELVASCRRGASLELCLHASCLSSEQTLSALQDLVRHGVLMSVRGDYAFVQDAMRGAVLATVDDERSQEIHARLADAFMAGEDRSLESRLEVSWHLLHTRRALEGADLLCEMTPALFETDISYAGATAAAELALAVYERNAVSLEKRIALRSWLLRAGYVQDYRLMSRYGTDTMDMLERWLGLARLRPKLPVLGAGLVMLLVLVGTFARWLFSHGERRGPSPILALRSLARSASYVLGVHTLALDGKNAGATFERLAPLVGMRGTPLALVYLSSKAFAMQPLGREVEVREACALALHELRTQRHWIGLTPRERLDLQVGLMMSSGINECYRLRSNALALAAALDALATPISRAAAQRVRMLYYTARGAREEAERHRRVLDVHAIQGGTTWQVEWFAVPVEAIASARFGDLIAARRGLERLEELAEAVPSLVTYRDMVRIVYQYRRGNLTLALKIGEEFTRRHPPRSAVGWARAYAAYAAALNDTGRYEDARNVCEQARSVLSDADREYVIMYASLDRELAMSYAGLGLDPESDALTQYNLARYEDAGEHALLTNEYENAARIAQLRGDSAVCFDALEKMRAAAARSGAQSVMDYAARVAGRIRRTLRTASDIPSASAEVPTDQAQTREELFSPIRRMSPSRARMVLHRAMEQTGAAAAHLLVVLGDDVRVPASAGGAPPPDAVEAEACALVASLNPGRESTVTARRALRTVSVGDLVYELTLLPGGAAEDGQALLALGRNL